MGKRFKYQPLDSCRQEIRVLRIRAFDPFDSGIHCDLKHVRLEKSNYVCLSYTWGSPTPQEAITVNARRVHIGASLYAFLLRARAMEITDWLWIDAICINQKDNNEKGHQVRVMKDIFSLAKHVLVYPGETSQDIDDLLVDPVLLRMKHVSDPQLISEPRRAHLISVYNEVRNLAYWSRMWIVQEILLAKVVLVIIDNHLVEWSDFSRTICPAAFWSPENEDSPSGIRALLDNRDGWDDPRTIGRLLHSFRENKCLVWHDRVYALIGMMDVPLNFAIDYKRSPMVVVLDVVEHLVLGVHSIQSHPDRLDDIFKIVESSLQMMPVYSCLACISRADPQLHRLATNQTLLEPNVTMTTNTNVRVTGLIIAEKAAQSHGTPACRDCGTYAISMETVFGAKVACSSYKRITDQALLIVFDVDCSHHRFPLGELDSSFAEVMCQYEAYLEEEQSGIASLTLAESGHNDTISKLLKRKNWLPPKR